MIRRRSLILLVLLGAVWLASTISLSLVTQEIEGFACTMELPVQYSNDVDGWSWSKDSANSCEWTLFQEGRRAPESVYVENGFEPPPDIRVIAGVRVPAPDTLAVSGVVVGVLLSVIAAVVAGMAWLVRSVRRGTRIE